MTGSATRETTGDALPTGLTRAAFLAWVAGQEDQWELWDGHPVLMAGGSAGHAELKAAADLAMSAALAQAGLPCKAYMDGFRVAGVA